jgi:RimJ/RimL family protein N-acetyltransferase
MLQLVPIAESPPAVRAALAAMLADRPLRTALFGGCADTPHDRACALWLGTRRPDGRRWAAHDAAGGDVLGALAVQAGELSFFVCPQRWGQGHGRAIVTALLAQPAWAAQPLTARVQRENPASRRILVSSGFVEVGLAVQRAGTPRQVCYRWWPRPRA